MGEGEINIFFMILIIFMFMNGRLNLDHAKSRFVGGCVLCSRFFIIIIIGGLAFLK